MAAELGTDLTRVTVGARDIGELMPRAIELSEKPTLRTALAPLLRLSRAVQDAGLKVVLTGEGADELFAGYDIFREDKVRRFWARDPESRLRPLLLGRLNAFLARDLSRSGAFLTSFYGRGLTEVDDPLYSHRIRFANTARFLRLLRPELLEQAAAEDDPLARLVARLPDRYDGFSALGKAQYLEITSFLEGYLLHSQGDRMLMGHSIEGRFPFLDYRVAELAARLPDRLRLRGLEEKYALRKAVAPFLPEEVHSRTKRPYRAPIGAGLRGARRAGVRPRPAAARADRAGRRAVGGGRRARRREVRGGRVGARGGDRRDGARRSRLDDAAARAARRTPVARARGRADEGRRGRARRARRGRAARARAEAVG